MLSTALLQMMTQLMQILRNPIRWKRLRLPRSMKNNLLTMRLLLPEHRLALVGCSIGMVAPMGRIPKTNGTQCQNKTRLILRMLLNQKSELMLLLMSVLRKAIMQYALKLLQMNILMLQILQLQMFIRISYIKNQLTKILRIMMYILSATEESKVIKQLPLT